MDNDKTLVQSIPGGTSAHQVTVSQAADLKLLSFGDGKGVNPVISAAAPLLILLAELKQSQDCADILKLRQRLVNDVNAFSSKIKLANISAANIAIGSYLLCAALDEVILIMLQQRNSLWARQSLLSVFHKDGGAGEKFFAILERLNQDPKTNQMLLELIMLCLNLGFEGKYRVMENGSVQLELLKINLSQQLIKLRSEASTLNIEVKPLKKSSRISLRIPFYKAAISLIVLLAVSFAAFYHFINLKADHSINLLHRITAQTMTKE